MLSIHNMQMRREKLWRKLIKMQTQPPRCSEAGAALGWALCRRGGGSWGRGGEGEQRGSFVTGKRNNGECWIGWRRRRVERMRAESGVIDGSHCGTQHVTGKTQEWLRQSFERMQHNRSAWRSTAPASRGLQKKAEMVISYSGLFLMREVWRNAAAYIKVEFNHVVSDCSSGCGGRRSNGLMCGPSGTGSTSPSAWSTRVPTCEPDQLIVKDKSSSL